MLRIAPDNPLVYMLSLTSDAFGTEPLLRTENLQEVSSRMTQALAAITSYVERTGETRRLEIQIGYPDDANEQCTVEDDPVGGDAPHGTPGEPSSA